MIVLALVLELLAMPAAVLREQLAAALAAHGLAALAAALGLGGRRRDERFFVGALVLTVPLAGLVGLALVRLWIRMMPPPEDAPEHASLDTLPIPERPRESLDAVFGWIQAELAVQPLGDAIRGSDPESQRWAVGLLERRGDPAAVALLREALAAPSRQTQILASGALRRLEERFVRSATHAKATALDDPTPATWTSAGDAYLAYAMCGLVDAAAQGRWLEDAASAYHDALALDGAHRAAMLGIARVRIAQDRPADAEAAARAAQTLEASAATDLLIAEALFAQGRWATLIEECRSAVAAGREHDLVAWWAARG